jgi:hypothetical protein
MDQSYIIKLKTEFKASFMGEIRIRVYGIGSGLFIRVFRRLLNLTSNKNNMAAGIMKKTLIIGKNVV